MPVGVHFNFSRPPWMQVNGTLLENQIVSTAGIWQPLNGYWPVSVTVEGTFTGNVNILVSNSEVNPDNTLTDFAQLGDPGGFIAPGSLIVAAPYLWIKATATLTAGTIRRVTIFGTGPSAGLRGY